MEAALRVANIAITKKEISKELLLSIEIPAMSGPMTMPIFRQVVITPKPRPRLRLSTMSAGNE